ncbi:hypothetical protein HW132_17580 [Brasilonema sp. CT11]|nr:hypothetical protein [Brasilonema sp. CT11]
MPMTRTPLFLGGVSSSNHLPFHQCRWMGLFFVVGGIGRFTGTGVL